MTDKTQEGTSQVGGLTDDQLISLYQQAQDQALTGIAPSIWFARAILAQAAPVQSALGRLGDMNDAREKSHPRAPSKFASLDGLGLHVLRIDELPEYLMELIDNYADGPHTEGYFGGLRKIVVDAVKWTASEVERKTNDERILAVQASKLREKIAALSAPVQQSSSVDERKLFDVYAADNIPQYFSGKPPTWGDVEANVRAEAWNSWQARAAISAPVHQVAHAPAGWKPVPVEPTEAIILAGDAEDQNLTDVHGIYRAMIEAAPQPPIEPPHASFDFDRIQMVLCPTCGNKRCPHANDPANYACTGSNEPGQEGSAYPKFEAPQPGERG